MYNRSWLSIYSHADVAASYTNIQNTVPQLRTEMEVAALNSTTTGGIYGLTLGLVPMGSLIMARLTPINVASSPGHSLILSRGRGEKLGEGLGSLLCHRLKMVDLVSTNRVHHFRRP